MAEYKEGLHKKVSTIFSGVPVPKSTGVLQAPPPSDSDHKNDETQNVNHRLTRGRD